MKAEVKEKGYNVQKWTLIMTIACAVGWIVAGVFRLVTVYKLKGEGSAKEGWVHLVVGVGWALTAAIPDLWNWGVPALLFIALAWEWDKRSSRSAVKDKADS